MDELSKERGLDWSISHPYLEDGADWFVVARLQLHMTAILELLDIVAPPQDPVTPCWNTALSASGKEGKTFRDCRPIQTS